jgi:uncharacterized protein (TIGR02145 family)
MSRFTNKRAFLLATLLVVALIGCKDSSTNFVPDTNPFLQQESFGEATFAENTINLSQETLDSSLLEVSSDGTEFVFSAGDPAVEALRPGTVMVMGISEKTPMGALRKVDRVERSQGRTGAGLTMSGPAVLVYTTDTTMEEAFESLELITGEIVLSPMDVDSIVYKVPELGLREKITRKSHPDVFDDGHSIKFSQIFAHNADTSFVVKLSGDIKFDLSMNLDIQISYGVLRDISLYNSSKVESNLKLESTYEVSFEKVHVLFEYWFPPQVFGPVVLLPIFEIIVGADGVLRAELSVESKLTSSYKAGIKYENQQWQPINEFQNKFDPPSYHLGGIASSKYYIQPTLNILLYGVVGPYAYVQGYLKASADINRLPTFKLEGGITSKAGFNVRILGFFRADVGVDVYDWNEIIYQSPVLPTLSTAAVSSITQTTAVSGGNVSATGGVAVTARGVVWSTSQNPTVQSNSGITNNGSGTGSFTSNLTALSPSTRYYVRAYATNSAGTAYGEQREFTTASSGGGGSGGGIPGNGVTDIDGNRYRTVIIGNQEWMAENLKVKRYRNGDLIPNTPDGTTWNRLSTGSWVYYNNDSSNMSLFGLLYNWHASTDSRGLCPQGWQFPSDQDWSSLVSYLGGNTVAGGKLKSVGTEYWQSPNTDATNETGFSGLPAGARHFQNNGTFGSIGTGAAFWTSDLERAGIGLARGLVHNTGAVSRAGGDVRGGYSVRCFRGVESGNDSGRDNTTTVVDVTNPVTGRVWMDRNLGASRAATSSTDDQAYGDLYQWGRAADGHQKRNSSTTTTLSSGDQPGHGSFIIAPNSPWDWRSPRNDNLWQGVNGINNPCPVGYRLPTEAEWNAERASWSRSNPVGAFDSPLKLPLAGNRIQRSGLVEAMDSYGAYWSSSVSGTNARGLGFYGNIAAMHLTNRAFGVSVRCLRD